MKMNFIKTIEEKGIEALSLIVAIAIWQLVADRVVHNKFLLPSFYDVIISFFTIVKSGLIFTDILTSLLHFSIGIVAAFVIGIPLGISMGWFKKADRAIDPIIEISAPDSSSCLDSFCNRMVWAYTSGCRFCCVCRNDLSYYYQYLYRF